jgi:cytochrome c oxidase subunit 2
MAIPATKTMMELNDVQDADMSIKVTGWQWKWEYEYLDTGVHFFSSLDEASNRARQLGSGIDPRSVPHYLLNVDHPLVIPVKTKIRFLFTAADVLHSWWVPDLGWKKDTIPGFINEAWTYVEKPGTYRGQCTELCGKDHGFMPIVVIAMEQVDYDNWVAEQKGLVAETNAAAEKEWSKDELIAKGESVYQNNCASCHMADGAGMAGAFPALTGSKLVTGDINSQIDLVYKGKGMMPAFGQMLSEVDFAAVITYTRNALGNAVGDSVQPSAIKSLKSSAPAQTDDKDEDDKDEGNT